MATLRDIKHRIRSVREIQKITRAMKMVATAKLRKVQKKQEEFKAFGHRVDRLFSSLAAEVEEKNHPFLQERSGKSVWVIVLTSDRGLCGAYNHHLEKAAEEFSRSKEQLEVSLLISGRQGGIYFRRRSYSIISLDLPEDIESRARMFSHFVTHSYLSGMVDRVYVISDRFRLNRERGVRTVQLLPSLREEGTSDDESTPENIEAGEAGEKITSYLMEPGIDSVFEQVCRLYLLSRFSRFYLDSEAAEQLGRMSAMDLATNNADGLIFDLTLSFNKARQEAITKELIDILGGSQNISI